MIAEKELVRVLKWVLANAPASKNKSVRERIDLVKRAVDDLGRTVRDVEESNR